MAAGTSVPSPSWPAQQIGKDWPKFSSTCDEDIGHQRLFLMTTVLRSTVTCNPNSHHFRDDGQSGPCPLSSQASLGHAICPGAHPSGFLGGRTDGCRLPCAASHRTDSGAAVRSCRRPLSLRNLFARRENVVPCSPECAGPRLDEFVGRPTSITASTRAIRLSWPPHLFLLFDAT